MTVVNEKRIEEIRKEIMNIEAEQVESRRYLNHLKEGEEYAYGFLQHEIRKVSDEFEVCKDTENPRLRNLVEEKNQLLQNMANECGEFLYEIENEQKNVNNQCSEKINELELEIRELRQTEVL